MSVLLKELHLECEFCPDSPRIIRDWISAGFEDAAKAMMEYREKHSACRGKAKEEQAPFFSFPWLDGDDDYFYCHACSTQRKKTEGLRSYFFKMHKDCGAKKEQEVSESFLAQKTQPDGLFAIATALNAIASAITDQTNRMAAVSQQIANNNSRHTDIQATLLKMHKEKASQS